MMNTFRLENKKGMLVCGMILALQWGCGKTATKATTTSSCNVLSFSGSANPSYSALGAFSVSPVTPASIDHIIPLGNLNPPGHTYPTDHMYFVLQNSATGANPVYAAAAGTVIDAYQPGGTDWKVVIQVDRSLIYYYDHLTLANGVKKGTAVTVGQTIGSNSGLSGAVDFGVYNYNNAPLTGILDSCLANSTAQVDSPLKYYSGSLQASLYALSGGQDGKIDYDQAGRLVGDWVLTGHESMDSTDVQLAFAYHVGSSSLRIAVGGTLAGGAATYAVQGGATDFSAITPESGLVSYSLYPTQNGDDTTPGSISGTLLVQMISASEIKVEIFQGVGSASGFDSNAKTYLR